MILPDFEKAFINELLQGKKKVVDMNYYPP